MRCRANGKSSGRRASLDQDCEVEAGIRGVASERRVIVPLTVGGLRVARAFVSRCRLVWRVRPLRVCALVDTFSRRDISAW